MCGDRKRGWHARFIFSSFRYRQICHMLLSSSTSPTRPHPRLLFRHRRRSPATGIFTSVVIIDARLDVCYVTRNTWVNTCFTLRLHVAFMRHAMLSAVMIEMLYVMRHQITLV